MLTALPCREESNSAWHSGPFLAPGSLADFSLQSFLLSHLPHILKRSSRLRIQSWPLLMLSLEHLSHSHSLSTGLTLSHSLQNSFRGTLLSNPFDLNDLPCSQVLWVVDLSPAWSEIPWKIHYGTSISSTTQKWPKVKRTHTLRMLLHVAR